jgi:hypothetical protein
VRSHRWLAKAVVIGVMGWQTEPLVLGPRVAAEKVKRGLPVKTVVATGNVETLFRANIGSQITGTVATVHVDERQRVSAGQLLMSLESGELTSALVPVGNGSGLCGGIMKVLFVRCCSSLRGPWQFVARSVVLVFRRRRQLRKLVRRTG